MLPNTATKMFRIFSVSNVTRTAERVNLFRPSIVNTNQESGSKVLFYVPSVMTSPEQRKRNIWIGLRWLRIGTGGGTCE
jgi:hypothetical protein